MVEFFTRYRNVSVLVGVLLLQFVLLGYQVKRNDDVRLLRVWTVGAISPIEKVLNTVSSFTGSLWRDYVWLVDAREHNHQLREQVTRLKLENQQFRRALARFKREEELLAYQEQILSEILSAEVIGRGSNPNSKEIFVDKGSLHGVQSGMPVITPDGIIGSVRASYHAASLVRLISDNNAGVGVVLAGSRAQGVMRGTGAAECRINYVGEEVTVEVGENVYTSGDDRIYPKGLPVGKITRLGERGDFQEIYVKPFAALNRLEEVLIITTGVHQELPELARPQAPQSLMPLPPPSGEEPADPHSPELTATNEEPETSTTSAGSGAERRQHQPPLPLTDADLVRERYEAIAGAQGHVWGEGEPGSAPPDFNLGTLHTPAAPAEAAAPESGEASSQPRPPGSAGAGQIPGLGGATNSPAGPARDDPQAARQGESQGSRPLPPNPPPESTNARPGAE